MVADLLRGEFRGGGLAPSYWGAQRFFSLLARGAMGVLGAGGLFARLWVETKGAQKVSPGNHPLAADAPRLEWQLATRCAVVDGPAAHTPRTSRIRPERDNYGKRSDFGVAHPAIRSPFLCTHLTVLTWLMW